MHIDRERIRKSWKESMKGTFQGNSIWIVWFNDLKYNMKENW